MNPYRKLFSNSAIFAIGDLGSRVISFLLLPLYTYYLTTEQYGVTDLILTTVNLLLPVVFLSIQNAVLRFIMDKSEKTDEIVSNTSIIAIGGIVLLILSYPLINYINIFGNNLKYLYFILVLLFLERYVAQYARAVGMLKIYAINGILLSFNLGMSNVLFLAVFNLGLQGYFYAYIISHFISFLFLSFNTRIFSQFSFSNYNVTTVKRLLKFSVPMIPNSIMWWLVNASSRFIIRFHLGLSANGLFAIASKTPAILSMINQIFTQAWQISAIEESENTNKESFYSNVFSHLASFSFVTASILTMAIKYIFDLLFSIEFFTAWKITPFLILGTVFSNLSSFLGTSYIVEKQTAGVFKTSIYGGLISLILNLLLIPNFGITGAGISSFISFLIMFLIRYVDTKKYNFINVDWKRLIISTTIIILQVTVMYFSNTWVIEILLNLILFVILSVVNKKIWSMFKKILQYLFKV